jgi:endonuclease YncB( thermonuclease family)
MAAWSECHFIRTVSVVVSLVASLPAVPCAATDLAGQASVIDGDTLEIHGTRIRLYGIDALESGQACMNGEYVYR